MFSEEFKREELPWFLRWRETWEQQTGKTVDDYLKIMDSLEGEIRQARTIRVYIREMTEYAASHTPSFQIYHAIPKK